ncbi:hypothetical protein [Streptomyces olivochromogenes]|uniref:hypothetical protein n=1 Tax=Streptomyces olivochromogenes TaxID=1963 RepID=UPI000ACA7EE3|nr:hypothetical protein [Streptomyces olivochromogenes]
MTSGSGAGSRRATTELPYVPGLPAPSPDGDDDSHDDRAERYGEGDLSGLTPQPSLSRRSTLVDRIAFVGLPVEVRISGEPRPLPPGVDVTACRIVQEVPANALEYSDDGKASVTVRRAGRSLRVGEPPGRYAGDKRTPRRHTACRRGQNRTGSRRVPSAT